MSLERLFYHRGIAVFSRQSEHLAELAAKFGFRFLALAVSGPEASSYDPLIIRNWKLRVQELEVSQKAQAELLERGILADVFPETRPEDERLVVLENAMKGKAVSVKNLGALLLLLRELEVHRVILLAEKKPTVTGLSLARLGIAVEWHPKTILDLLDHALVPPHRRLSPKEAACVRALVPGISAQLRTDDAVCRYYGFPVGCMVELLITVESVGTMPEYRIVR